jgi:hypothetical protein
MTNSWEHVASQLHDYLAMDLELDTPTCAEILRRTADALR